MQFVCRLGTADGRIVEQIHEAPDLRTARREIERRGLHIFEIRRRGLQNMLESLLGSGSTTARGGSRKTIPSQDFLVFNQQLAGLLGAGLPLLQCLELMCERQRNATFKEALGEIRDRVESGEELSEAFAAAGNAFPPIYASMLKAGEQSGGLEQVIRRYVRQLKLVTSSRKRVVSALFYPALLVCLSVGIVAVMMFFVMPRFEEFYVALDLELPWMTQALLGLSQVLRNPTTLVLGVAAAVGVWAGWRVGRSGRLGAMVDRFKLRLPIMGPVLHRFALSEFCRSLATLLHGGLPLAAALDTSTSGVTNRFLHQRAMALGPRIREGAAFHTALEESGVFTDLAIDMVKVGEATGALDEMVNSVSDFLDEDVETRTERLLSLVEPVMLVVMGCTIALLVLSMYLPLFSVLGQVQG